MYVYIINEKDLTITHDISSTRRMDYIELNLNITNSH